MVADGLDQVLEHLVSELVSSSCDRLRSRKGVFHTPVTPPSPEGPGVAQLLYLLLTVLGDTVTPRCQTGLFLAKCLK